jgi:hypothetical protein
VAEHVRVRPGRTDACGFAEPVQAAGSCVPVRPGAAAVERGRPAGPVAGCPVGGPAGGWRQWDRDHLGVFAACALDPVAVLVAEIGDVRAGGFEGPQ